MVAQKNGEMQINWTSTPQYSHLRCNATLLQNSLKPALVRQRAVVVLTSICSGCCLLPAVVPVGKSIRAEKMQVRERLRKVSEECDNNS